MITYKAHNYTIRCCSVTKSCLTLGDPRNCGTPGFLSFTLPRSLLKFMLMELVQEFILMYVYTSRERTFAEKCLKQF